MKTIRFTEKDWDEIMLKYPDLKKEYDDWLLFVTLNPRLARDIERKILKML